MDGRLILVTYAIGLVAGFFAGWIFCRARMTARRGPAYTPEAAHFTKDAALAVLTQEGQ